MGIQFIFFPFQKPYAWVPFFNKINSVQFPPHMRIISFSPTRGNIISLSLEILCHIKIDTPPHISHLLVPIEVIAIRMGS